jgi:DNA-binding CsgD family transcriptional regulator
MIGGIYDCALDPGRWDAVLTELAGLLGSSRAFLGVMTPAGQSQALVAAPGFTTQDIGVPENALNPIAPLLLTQPPDSAYLASRDYGLPRLKASRYYREFLALRDMLDAVGFVITREGGAIGHWLIPTPHARPPITDDEAYGLTLVAPHIRRATEISRVLGLQRLEAETCRAALEQLESPVLMLGSDRRIAFANPSAGQAIARGSVLRARGDRLTGATEEIERLLRAVTADAAAGGPANLEVAVTGTDGEERLLFAVGLGPHGDARLGLTETSVLVIMRSPRQATQNPVAIAARAFGLSPAQVQVLSFLAQGHAPDAIADILGVGMATIRTHLSALFQRTGTTRQAELVARTLSLASPLKQTAG